MEMFVARFQLIHVNNESGWEFSFVRGCFRCKEDARCNLYDIIDFNIAQANRILQSYV